MATLAMPSEAELSQLSKNDLIGVVQRAVGRLQAQGSRIKKLAAGVKATVLDHGQDIGEQALGYGAAALAGAGLGFWMGTIQRNIQEGKEGYDEESLLLLGFDKDLVASSTAAIVAYLVGRRVKDKGLEKYKPVADYLRMAAMGGLASWAGRMGYEYGMAPPEEEKEGAQQPA